MVDTPVERSPHVRGELEAAAIACGFAELVIVSAVARTQHRASLVARAFRDGVEYEIEIENFGRLGGVQARSHLRSRVEGDATVARMDYRQPRPFWVRDKGHRTGVEALDACFDFMAIPPSAVPRVYSAEVASTLLTLAGDSRASTVRLAMESGRIAVSWQGCVHSPQLACALRISSAVRASVTIDG